MIATRGLGRGGPHSLDTSLSDLTPEEFAAKDPAGPEIPVQGAGHIGDLTSNEVQQQPHGSHFPGF